MTMKTMVSAAQRAATMPRFLALEVALWRAVVMTTGSLILLTPVLLGGCSKFLPGAAKEVSASAHAPPSNAHLMATPNPVPVRGELGKTTLSWGTLDGSDCQVFVSRDGGPEQLLKQGAEGSDDISWIEPGATYEFRLYAGLEHKEVLASVTVKGLRAEH